jgi:hypothetical protein
MTDPHHQAASALSLLGVAAPLRLTPAGEDQLVTMTWAGDDERPLGILCPNGTLRVPGVDLPDQDQVLSTLLGCTLATRFQRQNASPYAFTAHGRTGLVTLEGPGPVAEIAVRRGTRRP